MHRLALAAAALAALPALPALAQDGIGLSMSQETYHYGDRLTFTLVVQEVTGEPATLRIVGPDGRGSSPISVQVDSPSTTVPSPFPLDGSLFPEGRYSLEVAYGGASASARFEVADGGRVVIPAWVKQVAAHWLAGDLPDGSFADAVASLAGGGILEAPGAGGGGAEASVPAWLGTVTAWWLQELVTDGEYARALQYLIEAGVLVV